MGGERDPRGAAGAGLPGAVLVDVDGTLVDTTYLHAVCWWQALRAAGHAVHTARIHRAVGMGSDHLLEHLLGPDRDRTGDRALSDAHSRCYRRYWDDLAALAGAADLLRACHRAGMAVVLASSAKPDELDVLRRAIDADDAISAATSAGDVESTKPAPDLVQVALRKAGVPPGRAVFVGDSVWDVHAAARAGVPCIAVTCGGTSEAELRGAGAVEVFRDPADLLGQLDQTPIGDLVARR